MASDLGKPFVDLSVMSHGLIALVILIFKDLKDAFGAKINFMHSKHIVVRYLSCVSLIAFVLLFGALTGGQFIYFQF